MGLGASFQKNLCASGAEGPWDHGEPKVQSRRPAALASGSWPESRTDAAATDSGSSTAAPTEQLRGWAELEGLERPRGACPHEKAAKCSTI